MSINVVILYLNWSFIIPEENSLKGINNLQTKFLLLYKNYWNKSHTAAKLTMGFCFIITKIMCGLIFVGFWQNKNCIFLQIKKSYTVQVQSVHQATAFCDSYKFCEVGHNEFCNWTTQSNIIIVLYYLDNPSIKGKKGKSFDDALFHIFMHINL